MGTALSAWWHGGGIVPILTLTTITVVGGLLAASPDLDSGGWFPTVAGAVAIGLWLRAAPSARHWDRGRWVVALVALGLAAGLILLRLALFLAPALPPDRAGSIMPVLGISLVTMTQVSLVVALLVWPRRESADVRIPYLIVDLTIILVAAVLFFWYLRLRPSGPAPSPLNGLGSVVAPMAAIVGVSIAVLRPPREETSFAFMAIVAVALLVFVTNFVLATASERRGLDTLMALLMTGTVVLAGLGAEGMRLGWRWRRRNPAGTSPVPWVAVLGIGAFVLSIGIDQISGVGPIVIGAVVTMGLLILRQALTMQENAQLLAERAALAADTRIAALVRHTSDAIVIADERLRIRYASPSAEVLWSRPSEQLMGVEMRSLFEGAARAAADQLLATCLDRPGVTDSARWEVVAADGAPRRVEVVAISLLHEPSVRGVVITLRDQTERIQLEEQLYQAQKMEAIGQLAGGVAHDFNNLLTTILGHAEVGLDLVPEDHPVREDLAQIKRASDMAAAMTSQLLAFSRKQVVEPRVVEVRDALERIFKILKRLITEHIRTVVEIDPGVGRIRIDPGRLHQVVINLAVNARDAMPGGGTLRIRALRRKVEAKVPSAVLPPPIGECVLIEFTDSGTGMDASTISRIFEPFFTTKPTGRGTGLGLATVYGILKQNGAGLVVRSSPGQGSTFSVYFPVAREQVEVDVEDGALGVPMPGMAATILLVEDEAGLREIAQKVLTREGFRVLVAADADEAETISASANFPIDLLLTDVVMPGVNGADLAVTLRRARPDLRVLFMSGYAGEDLAGALQPNERFLRKPFTPFVLLENVRAALVGLGGPSTPQSNG